ncbi:transporter [Paracidovorax cattleyae]|uniref:Putative MetA-pathway of phenol degradation n=1 Tax=Paracidovorax cattleyae TaxID=80868 RepID=A0A1H0PT35_9BURK|nr:transporter [Paracidovorax cattleyae]SDP07678.1 Putative MetA-pathway of phenol degradation [Paracidovorax cattleyae]
MTATRSLLHQAGGSLAMALLPLSAWAIDVDPGDYVPAPAGTTAGLLYYQHSQRDRLYAQGQQVPIDARLTSDVGILRLVRYMSVGGLTVAPQVLLPFGRLDAGRDTAALGRTSGVGDVILAAPAWLVNDPEFSTYLGISPYLYLPTGSYDRNRALNLGENRWKFDLQVGFVKGLTPHWHIDLTFDSMFHGRNDDSGPTGRTLKQDRIDQGQVYLRYQFTPGTNAFVGISQT